MNNGWFGHMATRCEATTRTLPHNVALKQWLIASLATFGLCSTVFATTVDVVTSGSAVNATSSPTAPSGASANTAPADTTPPIISGVLPGIAVVGQPFSFQPSASDTDGGSLTFAVTNQPSWTNFDPGTGRLYGTPQDTDLGAQNAITITVSDGTYIRSLPVSTVTVVMPGSTATRKSNYGHYFSTHYSDTPADAAMLCEQAGVSGVVWRQTWQQVETSPGTYDFSSFDQVLGAIAASHNPGCQLWLVVEFKSFSASPIKNPCPVYLQAQHSGLNNNGGGASTCFMWDPTVVQAYVAMMKAAAVHFDSNPRVEGLILQESALGFSGAYSQDEADGGTYTALGWRDALIELIDQCAASFANSRCAPFLNFLNGQQSYLYDVSAAISAIPGNQVCFSGPDVLPDSRVLYKDNNRAYEVLTRHVGCRSNSVQNDSYEVAGCGLDCIFHFAVSGTLGDFPETAPLSGGLCVNSYLFWNDRSTKSATGLDWTDALPVIAANPYGPGWYSQCTGNSGAP